MADVKPPPPSAPTESTPSTASTGPSNDTEKVAKSHRSSGSGGRRRGGGGGGGKGDNNADKEVAKSNDGGDHENSANNSRKKKPELEHYKPGAFSSRKPEDESNADSEESPASTSNNKKHRGGGGGNNSRKHNADVENTTEKISGMTIEGVVEKQTSGHNSYRRNHRKKPDQAHYVPKKSANSNESSTETKEPSSSSTTKDHEDSNKSKNENRKKNKRSEQGNKKDGKSNKKTEQNDKPKVVEESQRNGHVDISSEQQHHQRSSKSNNNRRGDRERGEQRGGNNTEHENLPPRLRQKDQQQHQSQQTKDNGGRSDRGRGSKNGNKSRGGNHNNSPKTNDDRSGSNKGRYQFHEHHRDSSSPMVSSEARSPSPANHHQHHRRDSAASKHNRRSHSPQRNVSSPTSYRGRRGGRGGSSGNNHRGGGRGYNDYHRESSDWRYDDHHHRGGDRTGNSSINNSSNNQGTQQSSQQVRSLPPRFQKSRDWSASNKDHHESNWNTANQTKQQSNRQRTTRQAVRDYEVDDTRVFDYEKDEDDDEQPAVTNRVSDWSLEVEEEEERLTHLANKQQAPEKSETNFHRGGILRLPPDAMTSSSSSQSSDWRSSAHQHQTSNYHQQQQQQYSRDNYNHYNDSNPAWRGVDRSHHQHPQQSNERYLFDPRNPKKPIPAQRGSGMRFPMDPRFAPPPQHNNGPPPPRMAGYRPPFPSAPNSAIQTTQDPKSLLSSTDSGNEATQILGANEIRLMAIVQSGGPQKLCQLWHQDVADARGNIMRTFANLLQTDLVFCARYDVEFFVWKICFYNLVATLKTWLQGGTIPQAERQVVEENVIELLDEGLDFYTDMLETLDKTYRIGLEQYYDVLEPRSSDTKIRCALVSAQKCLLCLGDLARYKEMIQNTSNYGKARQYYQKASHIDTRNAKPFNQLAILAWTAKRKFEAVYYHMRCLQTKTPVETSRQSLVEIFEDIRRRWDVSEKKRLEDRAQRKKEADSERDRMHLIKGTRLRKEIWVRPDGGRRLHRTTSAQEGAPDSEETELKGMSTTELNRRFNNAFLHLVGTLYTHINIDAFPMACDLLQKEFRILLSRSPLPIDCKRLVQIMALNMFIIEHTKSKTSVSDQYVSVTQNYALQLAFEMFGILVERCNDLMLSFIPSTEANNQSIFHDDDLPNLLSAVKVWCDWLMGNNDTWFPVLCDEPFNELAKLATHLEKLKPIISPILRQCLTEDNYLSLPHNDQNQFKMIKLDEDAVLCGFTPWTMGVNWNIYRRYAPRTLPTTLLQDARRLDAINFCVDFLEGLEPPVLKWSPPDNAHISLVENMGSTTVDRVNAKLTHMLSREQDILEESYSDEESRANKASSSSTDAKTIQEYEIDKTSKIGQLKIRKEELEKRRREDEETKKIRQQILSEHVSVTLEVCPKFVIPDTNCFVDYLPEIRQLSTNSHFQIRVPIVVLKELDGLAKGARPSKYASPEHAAMVAENARHALSFLKERPPNTRCVTSRGTVLASLGVTTEDDYDADKNNDDLILDACLNLAMHKEEIRADMRVVFRDLVLLTDDRNLKLKAHMTDIPVNKLSDFIHWAYTT